MTPYRVPLADYTEQAAVSNWPLRIALVAVIVALIAVALWAMRRGWRNRQERQSWLEEPADAPLSVEDLSAPEPGIFIGTATQGDWLDRLAVYDLGVRGRSNISWGEQGIWFDRDGARNLFIPADDVIATRTDQGLAGTVRAKDSVIVVTWRLGGAVVDTGFRALETTGHGTVLEGLTSTFTTRKKPEAGNP